MDLAIPKIKKSQARNAKHQNYSKCCIVYLLRNNDSFLISNFTLHLQSFISSFVVEMFYCNINNNNNQQVANYLQLDLEIKNRHEEEKYTESNNANVNANVY